MQNTYYFSTKDLCVGYNGKPLITNINVGINKGEILTLIGPNGSGKSTILKSITKHLSMIDGVVYIDKISLDTMINKDMATKLSIVLTEKIQPEMMTCKDVVATGRYPYTNYFGKLTECDEQIVEASLKKVHALELSDKEFTDISDGQRQRVMLARAICQEPEIIVLDEPTSYLDIKHKIELLDILRKMSREKGITVIMSLHEIDLASKISDKVMCVKGDTITKFGSPKEIFQENIINELYDIEDNSYNMLFGCVELPKVKDKPRVLVLAGGGCGIQCYRELQNKGISFSTGILYENDIDYEVAKSLAVNIYSSPAFYPVKKQLIEQVKKDISNYDVIVDIGVVIGEFNTFINEVKKDAKQKNIPIINDIDKVAEYLNGK